jgi:AcrR family transcriptional regulator
MNLDDSALPITESSNKTLDRILACALEHFSRYGYLGASVREITGSAQVTKPTLYYYFRNKEDLYRALAETSFEKMITAISMDGRLSGNLVEDFCGLIDCYYQFCESDLPAARFVQMVSFAPTRDVPDVGVNDFKRKIDLVIEKIVEAACRSSELEKPKHAKLELVLQGLFSLATERRLGGLTILIPSLREALASLVL